MVRRALFTAFLVACSSSEEPPEQPANVRIGDIRENQVWTDGIELTGQVNIYAGATVEIEPGARIKCSPSSQILVGGVLRVKAAAKHATISCPRWPGIVVAEGGTAEIEGLDIENAEVGFHTSRGSTAVNITDSSILTTIRPALINEGSVVTMTRVKATTPTTLGPGEESKLEVRGKLIAKFLDYDANTNEGIWLAQGGEAEIEDSTLKAQNGRDLVSSRGGKSLKVRYSTLRGAHCGPHLEGIGTFEIDHVTSEDNIYGITIYNASIEGPHVVKNSNLAGHAAWLDLQGDHGPIQFENVFTSGGKEVILNTDPPKVKRAPARIEGAQPR